MSRLVRPVGGEVDHAALARGERLDAAERVAAGPGARGVQLGADVRGEGVRAAARRRARARAAAARAPRSAAARAAARSRARPAPWRAPGARSRPRAPSVASCRGSRSSVSVPSTRRVRPSGAGAPNARVISSSSSRERDGLVAAAERLGLQRAPPETGGVGNRHAADAELVRRRDGLRRRARPRPARVARVASHQNVVFPFGSSVPIHSSSASASSVRPRSCMISA